MGACSKVRGRKQKASPLRYVYTWELFIRTAYVEGIQASADARESVRKIRYVCMICNRMEEYPEDRPTPVCCGQPMISMD